MLPAMIRSATQALLALVALATITSTISARQIPAATRSGGVVPDLRGEMKYDVPFVPNATYDPAVPTPTALLGERVGGGYEAASHADILRAFDAWSKLPRAKWVSYGTTHGGRPLGYLVISSPANLARLDAIKGDIAKLADARQISGDAAVELASTVPAVAWMAYCIHGDEPSGSDAAIQVAYHLLAATGEKSRKLLDDLIIIIDPVQNPDGRDRYVNQMRDNAVRNPTADDQTIRSDRPAPRGRQNHYMFDLNRDLMWGVHPESRGRLRSLAEWRPLLMVDIHEMGGQDTFLFGPARQPLNPNQSAVQPKWGNLFAKDQAAAFADQGWRHYSGEWNDELYPGYSGSHSIFRGSVFVLYEQAHSGADGIRLANGLVRTYRQSVHQQFVSSLANIGTLAASKAVLWSDYLATRASALANNGPYANRTWAVVPTGNDERLGQFLELLGLHTIEFTRATAAFDATGTDPLGKPITRTFPVGTILIPNRQPDARLAAALLEFDTRLRPDFLALERRDLVRKNDSRMYDVTAWSIPLYFDLDAVELTASPTVATEKPGPTSAPSALAAATAPAAITLRPQAYAHVIDGLDDRAPYLAARLAQAGVRVRIAKKPFRFDGKSFPRASLLIARDDQGSQWTTKSVDAAALISALGLTHVEVRSGYGEIDEARDTDPMVRDDPVDIGGEHFPLLAKPRVAVIGRGRMSALNFGEIWHHIDQRIGIAASYLAADDLGGSDLRRYNVIILPEGNPAELLRGNQDRLKKWVESGGTLIAIGGSAAALARPGDNSFSSTRLLADVLDKVSDYELAVLAEFEGARKDIDLAAVYANTPPGKILYPWTGARKRVDAEELKRREQWQSRFSPRGAVLAARVDGEHFLTLGLRDTLPVLFGSNPVLMAGGGVEAPVRLGVVSDPPAPTSRPSATTTPTTQPDTTDVGGIGWVTLPPGKELRLRMSGLLWPEAADRLAHSAYVTRESVGNGQVILFANNPVFRGATLGTARVFTNAVIIGPGLGASETILP